MIEPITRTILAADEAVAALVADRIYFQIGPQDEQRARLILQTISDTPAHTMTGPGGWTRVRIQVDVYAPSYRAVKELAQAVTRALNHKHGTSGDERYHFEHESSRDLSPTIPTGKEKPASYRVSMDFLAVHMT